MARETYHGLFSEGVCVGLVSLYATLGAYSLVMAILLVYFRHNAGIASRHPQFSVCHCVVAVFYCWLVLPLSCLIENDFSVFFLFRAVVIFAWFWASLCRYRMLQFDNDFLVTIKMATISNSNSQTTKFLPNKKDFGNATLSAAVIAVYFIICMLILIIYSAASSMNSIAGLRAAVEKNDLQPASTLAELMFTVMCILPFAVIMFWVPHSIWDIQESWKIRDELVFIFISTSILFFWDTAATAFDIFLDIDAVIGIKVAIEAAMLVVTVAMCSTWVIIKVPRDRVRKAPSLKALSEAADKAPEPAPNPRGEFSAPLGYVLTTDYGYKKFFQHCVDEINVENLQFLSEICFFKKQFLQRIEKLHFQRQSKSSRQSNNFIDHDADALMIDPVEPWKKQPRSFADRFSVAAASKPANNNLIWSPSNSLAILTLKMKHGLEQLPPLREDDEEQMNGGARGGRRRKRKNRKPRQNKIAEWHKKYKNHKKSKNKGTAAVTSTSNIEETLFKGSKQTAPSSSDRPHLGLGMDQTDSNTQSQHTQHVQPDDFDVAGDADDIPLYVMGYGLYLKFIKEGGDYEINISAKTRNQLHKFFDPSNMTSLDDAGADHLDEEDDYKGSPGGGVTRGGSGATRGGGGLTAGGGGMNGRTPNGATRGGGVGSNSITPRGPNGATRGGWEDETRQGRHNTAGGPDDEVNEELYLYELLKERENPNSPHSHQHLYKLYHIFDGAWAEIFHLIVSNVYPRFTSGTHYVGIKEELRKDLDDEKPYLLRLLNGECNDWFERVRPRSLVIIGVDRVRLDKNVSYWAGKFGANRGVRIVAS